MLRNKVTYFPKIIFSKLSMANTRHQYISAKRKVLALVCILPLVVLMVNSVVRSYSLTSKTPTVLEINENHDSETKEKESKEKLTFHDLLSYYDLLLNSSSSRKSTTLSSLNYSNPFIEIVSPPPERS